MTDPHPWLEAMAVSVSKAKRPAPTCPYVTPQIMRWMLDVIHAADAMESYHDQEMFIAHLDFRQELTKEEWEEVRDIFLSCWNGLEQPPND